MRLKIKLYCPKNTCGTAWWRVTVPFEDLRLTEKIDVEYYEPPYDREAERTHVDLNDVCFFQRPFSDTHLKLFLKAKGTNKLTWLDYDDDLFCIPFSNRAFNTYASPKIKSNITKMIEKADILTVSTEQIKETLKKYNENIFVAHNAMSWSFLSDPYEKKKTKIIAWRGSNTHDEDLLVFLPYLKKIASEYQDWRFIFIGEAFFGINELPKNRTMKIDAMTIPEYFGFLNDINPEIAIVPLIDNKFNRSKSNIAYQEFGYSQAAVLAPDWQEWRHYGCTNYSSPEDFYEKLKHLIEHPKLRAINGQIAMNNVLGNMSIREANEPRRQVISKLLEIKNGRLNECVSKSQLRQEKLKELLKDYPPIE